MSSYSGNKLNMSHMRATRSNYYNSNSNNNIYRVEDKKIEKKKILFQVYVNEEDIKRYEDLTI